MIQNLILHASKQIEAEQRKEAIELVVKALVDVSYAIVLVTEYVNIVQSVVDALIHVPNLPLLASESYKPVPLERSLIITK